MVLCGFLLVILVGSGVIVELSLLGNLLVGVSTVGVGSSLIVGLGLHLVSWYWLLLS